MSKQRRYLSLREVHDEIFMDGLIVNKSLNVAIPAMIRMEMTLTLLNKLLLILNLQLKHKIHL